ncbi:hypothetical protein N7474_005465 [Penicillium riverlandense]|uniref:uncharacterized protein n=1 Tax=Penicillium riverlandense TaxID=1903569 RepID=UPI0025486623|nr:uncharacterized protein N7474_005465 [Penicillium riverlandense]KAJ5819874.1 hypothetical protein N7474_005465 [Penicillium riverlandense]
MQSNDPNEESVFEPPPKWRSVMRQQNSSSEMAAAARSDYLSIFTFVAEIPRFFVSYRWWEDEATTVLWAFNIQEISHVIRYGLFRDESLPRSSLLSRNADTIDNFLIALSQPREHQFLANLSHLQRVEEILRRASITPTKLAPWSWSPPPPGHSLDACAVAAAIEAESHLHFTQIAFEEIVRASLGYEAGSIEWFLLQHTALHIHLLDHLRIYPEEIPLYLEVEKQLRTRSPFAHRAVVQSIITVQPRRDREVLRSSDPGFEFISGPIQTLFRDQPPSLTTILKVFTVLAVRFQRQYVHTTGMNWKVPFDTSISFLEYCLTSTTAGDLAHTLTSTDEVDFAGLSRTNLVAEDAVVKQLLANWRTLSASVWECCSALPDLIPHLQDCAQNLYTTRNYHSLTALLDGLHKYSISTARARNTGSMVALDPCIPPTLLFLFNPSQNHSAYRQHYHESPGIPFLLPHIRDYKQNGESVLQPLLQYLQRSLSFKR